MNTRATVLPVLLVFAFILATVAALLWMLPAPVKPGRYAFQAGAQTLLVEFLADDLVHLEFSAQGHASDVSRPLPTSPMVAKRDYAGPTVLRAGDDGTFETLALKVQIHAATLCVTVTDTSRELDLPLTTICPENFDKEFRGLTLTPEGFTHAYGLGQKFVDVDQPDGDWVGRARLPGPYGNVQEPFNDGNVANTQIPVAFFAGRGTESYGLFVDNEYKQYWDFRGDLWKAYMYGDQVRLYLMAGPDLQDVRGDYLELTGRPPVPPKRAFGLWVSEYGYDNWGELEDKLATLRENGFPVDGFVLDLQWYGGIKDGSDDTRMGSLSWDEQNFPDPAGTIARLRDEGGVGLITIEQSYVGRDLPEYATLAEKGYLVRACEGCAPVYLTSNPWWGKGGMIDWTNPDAGAFWHDWKREPLIDLGIVGHWTDLGEPEAYKASAWYYGATGASHTHQDAHNLYNLLWSRSIYDGYARNGDVQRPFILSRSGTAGSQRYGVAMWSGDISGSPGSLATQFNAQMHMAMSGIDYYGSDIGGFYRDNYVLAQEYTPWFAASMFTDVPGRAHAFNVGNWTETAPDRVGDPASNLQNIRLRYELVPYVYSLAHRAYRFGEPVVPPLVYYYPNDLAVREMGGEKLIGRDLLVALVSAPEEMSHQVYLPAGRWIDYHSAAWIDSTGQWLDPVLLYPDGKFTLPLYARAGAILPQMYVDDQTMNVLGQRLDGTTRDELIVRVYASPDATRFTLYEDDGATVAYQRGEVRTTELTQQQYGNAAVVTIAGAQGTYAGAPAERDNVVRIYADAVGPAVRVTLNGAPLAGCATQAEFDAAASGWYSPAPGQVVAKSGKTSVTRQKVFRADFGTPEAQAAPAAGALLPAAWPGTEWQAATPAQAGMRAADLARLLEYLEAQNGDFYHMLVTRRGYSVLDARLSPLDGSDMGYLDSTTKSVVATLVGIAIDQGYLEGVDQPVLDFFPGRSIANLDANKRAMTIEHLLTMTAGLDCSDGAYEDGVRKMQASRDWVQYYLDLPMKTAPGTEFNYCVGDLHLLSAILQQVTGRSTADFAQQVLFTPLGIGATNWPADPQGVSVGWADIGMTPADMAKIGYLYLRGGEWNGQRIVSSEWISAATSARVHTSIGDLGYQWWIDPLGGYFAQGMGTQWLVVVPDAEMVSVVGGGLRGLPTLRVRLLFVSFVLPSLQAPGDPPEDPAAQADLQARLDAIARGLSPQPVPAPPAIAAKVAGRTYVLDQNPMGWESFTLTFPTAGTAQFALVAGGAEMPLPVGLEGVYRVVTSPASGDIAPQIVALRGAWQPGDRFTIDYMAAYNPAGGTITLNFEGDTVRLQVRERGGHAEAQGHAQP